MFRTPTHPIPHASLGAIAPLVSPAWLARPRPAPAPRRPALEPAARPARPRRESERPGYAAHFHGACGGYL